MRMRIRMRIRVGRDRDGCGYGASMRHSDADNGRGRGSVTDTDRCPPLPAARCPLPAARRPPPAARCRRSPAGPARSARHQPGPAPARSGIRDWNARAPRRVARAPRRVARATCRARAAARSARTAGGLPSARSRRVPVCERLVGGGERGGRALVRTLRHTDERTVDDEQLAGTARHRGRPQLAFARRRRRQYAVGVLRDLAVRTPRDGDRCRTLVEGRAERFDHVDRTARMSDGYRHVTGAQLNGGGDGRVRVGPPRAGAGRAAG
jgi:hypothetical protein